MYLKKSIKQKLCSKNIKYERGREREKEQNVTKKKKNNKKDQQSREAQQLDNVM